MRCELLAPATAPIARDEQHAEHQWNRGCRLRNGRKGSRLAVDEIVHDHEIGSGHRLERSKRGIPAGDAHAPDLFARIEYAAQKRQCLVAQSIWSEDRAQRHVGEIKKLDAGRVRNVNVREHRTKPRRESRCRAPGDKEIDIDDIAPKRGKEPLWTEGCLSDLNQSARVECVRRHLSYAGIMAGYRGDK